MELINGLPPSVAEIAEHLARMARAYDNHLKWNEQAKFKADLMNVSERWYRVDDAAFSAKLRNEGMREGDVGALVDWLRKAQAGRRLIPQRVYRDFRFNHPSEQPERSPHRSSRDW